MTTLTRGATRRSATGSRLDDVLDELRVIRARHGRAPSWLFLAEFAARHRLTHREVDALLVAWGRDTVVTSGPAADEIESNEVASAVDEATNNLDPASREQALPAATPSDDLDWMFGEEPELATPRAADDVVGRAFDDLLGDWSRQGHLTRADVALLASRRRLNPPQHGELLDLLADAGVELPDPAGPRPRRVAQPGYEFHGDATGQYLRAIGRYPLIDGSREIELWSLISQGVAAQSELDKTYGDAQASSLKRSLQIQVKAGRRAHAELVCANLRLVVSIAKAKHYDASGVEFADRIQDGNLGLMHAADKFDGSKGFKFSTYATWWIRQSIERGIGDRGRLIRLPIHFHERARKVRRAIARLTARLDREPSLVEMADATGMELGQVQAVLDLTRPAVSLDSLLGDQGDLRLSDVLVAEDERDGRADPAEIVAHAMMRADLTRALAAVLPPRDVRILERRFGIGTGDEQTLDEIGAAFGVTRERIRQIQQKSLSTLRQPDQIAHLAEYLMEDSTAAR